MQWVPAGSFARLSGAEALWRAFRVHVRGKLRRPAVARFALDGDRAVFALHRALRAGSYRPGPFWQQIVRDPKVRLISTPTLRDRVVHQAVVAELGPHYDRSAIDDSFACRLGSGQQRAALRFLAFSRRWSFRLSLDVSRYFASVDHGMLLEQVLFPRLHDAQTRTLLATLVRAGGTAYRTPMARRVLGVELPEGTGLPIGSCLSQWAANLYLDGLDHFVKRTLKVRGYLRYMDDFSLFGDDPVQLRAAREAVVAWLRDHRRLELGRRRWHVHDTREPAEFVGCRVTRGGLLPAAKVWARMPARLREAARRGPSALARTVASYRAIVSFG